MSLLTQIQSVRKHAGVWMRHDHTVLRFHGADARSWLHNQTTNDVLGLSSGQGNVQALVNRQGRLQCVLELYRFEDECWAVIEKSQAPALMERYESHHFMEDVAVSDVGAGAPQVLVEGPSSALLLLRHLDPAPALGDAALPGLPYTFSPCRLCEHDVLVFRTSESGEDGFLILPAPGEERAFYEALASEALGVGMTEVEESARATLRLESGWPMFGRDWDGDTVIAETPFESMAVSYDKGCYLGQEVVTRLKTYGTPKLSLVGLMVEGDSPDLPSMGSPLYRDGERVGVLCAFGYSPTLQCWIARAYLNRECRTATGQIVLSDADVERQFRATPRFLPLYAPATREEQARRLYNEALAAFERDAEDQDESAIHALEDALRLAPDFEDAYEALGVILHRHHRVDEAIAIMKKLAALNPECVMAHTNLSVFYVSKGMIREAEEEKALAGQLELRQKADARLAERQAAEERARIEAEARERVGMFLEVLEFDPEDPIATMGLGSAYMQLGEYDKAIPHLQAAARLQKDYSAAYLALGKCYEFTAQTGDALAAYREGIAAAGRKGDLMPLREMERRMKALEDSA